MGKKEKTHDSHITSELACKKDDSRESYKLRKLKIIRDFEFVWIMLLRPKK